MPLGLVRYSPSQGYRPRSEGICRLYTPPFKDNRRCIQAQVTAFLLGGAFALIVWSAAVRARLTRRLPGIAAVPGGPRPQRDVRVPGKKATPEQSPADGVFIAVSGRADDAEPASRTGRPYWAGPTRRITTVTGEVTPQRRCGKGKSAAGGAMHHRSDVRAAG